MNLETGVSTGLSFLGQPSPRIPGTMIPTLLWVILWANGVIKWGNKICLDPKTIMMLWEEFLRNHEKVDFKLIMKQYWLLSVENDEVIVRNGCEKEDLKIWKKQIFISWFSVFFSMSFNESEPYIYSWETENGRWVC